MLEALELALLVEEQHVVVADLGPEIGIAVRGEENLAGGTAVEFRIIFFDQEPAGEAFDLLTLVFSPDLKNQILGAVYVMSPLIESNDSVILLLVGTVSLILTQLQFVVILLAMFIDWASDKIIECINKIRR